MHAPDAAPLRSVTRLNPTIRPLDIPDLPKSNRNLTETEASSKAGGVQRLPLRLFGLSIALMVDLLELLLYNIEQPAES